jgi:hypothetical protein
MSADWDPARVSSGLHGGRILDTARGILIGLRRCPSQKASDELLAAARRHKVPVFALAWALVRLAGDGGKSPHTFSTAQSAARDEWGELFTRPAVPAC